MSFCNLAASILGSLRTRETLPKDQTVASTGVDLHLHTTASDGRWTPEGLVLRAARLGIGVIAVTDHDTIAAIEPASTVGADVGVTVIPGVEVTSKHLRHELHVLIYGNGIRRPTSLIRDMLATLEVLSHNRVVWFLERLAASGTRLETLPTPSDRVPRYRTYDLSRALRRERRERIVPKFRDAAPYLAQFADAPEASLALANVVATAHDAGAVAVLAHPGRSDDATQALSVDDLEHLLAEVPLDGIESHHPQHSPDQRDEFIAFALKHRLLVTAGSDSHGPAHARQPFPHPASWVGNFLNRIQPASIPIAAKGVRRFATDLPTSAIA